MNGKSLTNATVRETAPSNHLELGGSWQQVLIGYCLTCLENQFEA